MIFAVIGSVASGHPFKGKISQHNGKTVKRKGKGRDLILICTEGGMALLLLWTGK
jgi:hypothetical protein